MRDKGLWFRSLLSRSTVQRTARVVFARRALRRPRRATTMEAGRDSTQCAAAARPAPPREATHRSTVVPGTEAADAGASSGRGTAGTAAHSPQEAPARPPLPANHEGKCKFYVEEKKRYCKLQAGVGKDYCGVHARDVLGTDEERVPCPIDPRHDVAKRDLAWHVKRCPAALQRQRHTSAACVEAGANEGHSDDDADVSVPGAAEQRSVQQQREAFARFRGLAWLRSLMRRVEAAHRVECGSLEGFAGDVRELRPPECEPYMKPDRLRAFNERHAKQQASIAAHLADSGLLTLRGSASGGNGVGAIVELGAGKGYLSQMIVDMCFVDTVVLVDNAAFRLKADRHLRDRVEFLRMRLGIEEVNCHDAPPLLRPEQGSGDAGSDGRRWIGVGKHLCGAATDFALRACVAGRRHDGLAQRRTSDDSGLRHKRQKAGGEVRAPCVGLGVSTCCHHRCTWRHLCGKELFRRHEFSKEEFEIVSWMTGWALCGHDVPPGCGDDSDGEGASGSGSGRPGEDSEGPRKRGGLRPGGLTWREVADEVPRAERMRVGMMCKHLIDAARLEWLRDRRVEHARIVKYVAPEVSGENRLLLARFHANDDGAAGAAA
ncbi:unnamed protein product [Pedinophyceae sp. YPF-701]|nr:unnamed protein product [Pedinophyceae sp. YPF-701]